MPLTIFSRAQRGIPKLAIRAITGTAKNLKKKRFKTTVKRCKAQGEIKIKKIMKMQRIVLAREKHR